MKSRTRKPGKRRSSSKADKIAGDIAAKKRRRRWLIEDRWLKMKASPPQGDHTTGVTP